MGGNPYRYGALCISSFLILFWVFGNEADELRFSELAIIALVAALVLLVQCGMFGIADRLTGTSAGRHRKMARDLYFIVMFSLNAYFFGFVLIENAISIQMLYAALAGVAMAAVLRFPRWAGVYVVFAAVFAVQALFQYVYTRIEVSSYRNVEAHSLPFQDGRNVYLISFESLHSPRAFRELYDQDRLGHVDYLKSQGFRIFDEAFSVDLATRTSYQRMLEFSRQLKTLSDHVNVLRRGNSTFRSFKDSGYKIQFLYRSNYFGLNSGIVDYSFPPDGFYICDNLPPFFAYLLCRERVVEWINTALYGVRPVSHEDQIEHLRQRVRQISEQDEPWLTINHIAFPNHTPLNFRFDNRDAAESFKSWMRANLPEIKENYRKTIGYILEHDPDSVIITFGDHGAWLSRGMETTGIPALNGFFSRKRLIRDRYSIMLGVYPADFCVHWIFEGSTTSDLVDSLMRCLDGDDNPTEEERARSRLIFVRGVGMKSVDDLLQ